MADTGLTLNSGSGGSDLATDVAADSRVHQYVKIEFGASGTQTPVTAAAPLPVDGSGVTQPVSAASLPLPSGAATSANQTTVIGHLDGVEALLTTIDADTSNLSVVGGGLEATAIRVTIANDSTGVVSIDDNGGAITVDGTVAITSAGITTIAGAVAGTEMQCDVLTLPAIPAGTNNIGDVDILSIAAGDNNIGNVDVVTMPNVTLAAGTNTNEVVGDVAHDAAASGNPVGISGVAQTMDDTAPPNRVSAEGDATRLATSLDGSIFAHPHGPQVWSYHVNGSSALTDATVHASPGAGLSLYVTDIVISSGAATAINVFFEESTTTVLGPYYLEAVAGRGCAIHFGTPKKITAATALTVTSSAAIAHAIDVTGYVAPA